MTMQFKLPPKRIIDPVPEDPDIILKIYQGAMQQSEGDINKILEKLSPAAEERLIKAAAEEGSEPGDYLLAKCQTMAVLYLGCRTDLLTAVPSGEDRDITAGTASEVLSGLAKIIGPNITNHIMRTISYNVDCAIEDQFGPELA